MTNQSAKKTKSQNDRRFKMTLLFAALPTVIQIVFIVLSRQQVFSVEYSTQPFTAFFGIALVAHLIFLKMIHSVYSSGGDISAGFCEYYFDAIIVNSFVQLTSLYSLWFWIIWLLVFKFFCFLTFTFF
eukprot:TRINITY_DN692_c0_g1_i2.p1 TRINITY_DN692_c0_g1~~TRINITY_DN692_c0_g1_i2.p1  ORF type:complete len:128 (-),score=28.99 TRINITY_DN692_c0_g1_i2:237-620(-)